MADFSQAPYYDDYDASKDYTKILAVPGRVEQAREFTQSQTIQQEYLSRLGESLYPNGTVIEGCTLFIDEDNNDILDDDITTNETNNKPTKKEDSSNYVDGNGVPSWINGSY